MSAPDLVDVWPASPARTIARWIALGAAAGAGVIASRVVVRALPRKCPKCSARMVRLGDAEKQAHLDDDAKREERDKVASYDVWRCPMCRHLEDVRTPALVRGYVR